MSVTNDVAPVTSLPPRRISGKSWRLLLGAFLLGAIALATHAAYFSLPHAHDDRYIQYLAGLQMTGRMDWGTYLLSPYEGHFMPLWRLAYHAQLLVFGTNPWPWHLLAIGTHAVGAMLLWRLLARYLRDEGAAWLGAALWAAASIGRWDNPLAWMATGLNAHSLTLLLAALWCQAHFVDRQRWRWLAAALGCLVLAVSMSGPFLVLSVVMPAQILLLERVSWRSNIGLQLLIGWLAIAGLLAALEAAIVLPAGLPRSVATRWQLEPLAVVRAMAAQALVALIHLANGQPWSADRWPSTLALVATGAGLLAVLIAAGSRRRVLLVFGGLGLIHLFAADVFRGELPAAAALGWGRYLYVVTLSWSVVAAMLVAIVRDRCNRPLLRNAVLVAALVLAALPIVRQGRLARAAADDHRRLTATEQRTVAANVTLLTTLERHAADARRVLRVPDISLDVPPARDVYYPVSAFAAVHLRGGLQHLQFVSPSEWTAGDERLWREALAGHDEPQAARWATLADYTARWVAAMAWLDQQAMLTGETLSVPSVRLAAPPANFPLLHLAMMAMDPPPKTLAVRDARQESAETWRKALARITQNSPQEAFWRAVYEHALGPQSEAPLSLMPPPVDDR